MSDPRETHPTAAELVALDQWLGQGATTTEPDAMELAAWLGGALSEGEAARVEAWLAREPMRLDALLATREAAAEMTVVPEADIRRAQALVADSSSRRRPASAWPLRLAGGGLVLAGAGGGLAVGLALAQSLAAVEGLRMMTLFADFGGLPGVW